MGDPTHTRTVAVAPGIAFAGADRSNEARFGERVKVLPSGCWAYNGDLDNYGRFAYPTRGGMTPKSVPAHRFAYETLVGQIPEGQHVHHRCQHPGCVNPTHLQAVTPAEHAAEHALMRAAG